MNDLGRLTLHREDSVLSARRKLHRLVRECGGDDILAARVAGVAPWVHLEKLRVWGSEEGFTRAQGE